MGKENEPFLNSQKKKESTSGHKVKWGYLGQEKNFLETQGVAQRNVGKRL